MGSHDSHDVLSERSRPVLQEVTATLTDDEVNRMMAEADLELSLTSGERWNDEPPTRRWGRSAPPEPPPARISEIRVRDLDLAEGFGPDRAKVLLWLTIVLAVLGGLGLAYVAH